MYTKFPRFVDEIEKLNGVVDLFIDFLMQKKGKTGIE